MNIEALRARLLTAQDYEEWVGALAASFREGDIYFGHGTDNPEDEAFWLIRHLQGWREDAWQEKPDKALADPAVAIARQRIDERVPLAYVLGEAWFAGLPFFVNRDVLIPRSPMAELIERGFEPWVTLDAGDRVLDVGTGSGCLAVAAAHFCPEVQIDATDVSPGALAVAARNIERHGCAERVQLHEADLFPSGDCAYRVIISNPPYVPVAAISTLPAEYRAEPELALVGGVAGIEPAEQLLVGARKRLVPGGVLIVEVGAEAPTFMERHPRLPVVWLDFERGGEGVFVVTAEQLNDYSLAR